MKKVFALVTFLSIIIPLTGQENNLTFQFNRILFRDMVDTIEKHVPVTIYYSDKWVDSLYLDVSSQNNTVDEILNKALKREGLSFIITDNDKVIISKGYSIKTSFQKEYSEYLKRNIAEAAAEFERPAAKVEETTIGDEYRIFRIGKASAVKTDERVILSGVIRSANNGEPVPGVVVYVDKLKSGAMTNNSGYYSISLPQGQYRIDYRMIGMKPTSRNVVIYSNGPLDVEMTDNPSLLNEVVVSANRENAVKNTKIGIEKINIKMLKQIPLGLGEADLIKSSLMLPGVVTVGEASSGFNVRGGSTDQNLVLLNYAPIINSSHFFGFFSAFNTDMITDVTLFKSGMPAKYGGRLSSVMEIIPAEGNKEKIKVNGGISPMTGRLLVEGPVIKEKVSFILGARTTYSDWLLGMLNDYRLKNGNAGFFDLQGALNADLNDKNSFSLSGYYSNDRFDYYKESGFNYGNLAATLKWKHTFSTKLSAQFFGIISNYDYQLDTKDDSTNYSSLFYDLNQKIIRTDFTYRPNDNHKLEYGLDAPWYPLLPGRREPFGDYSDIEPKLLEKERALEPSLYLSDEYEITPLLTVSAGIRATAYTMFGPGTEFRYADNLPRSVESINDTVSYDSGNIVKTYPGIDFRVSSRFIITPKTSVKVGIQRSYQYLHMISNTTSMSPIDIWKLSDSYIKPQRGDQVSLGYYVNFDRKAIETSIEAYYKRLTNTLDYKGGAELLMNEHLETDIINGKGKAYGVELMLKKQSGSVTGWVSYTYSRVFMKVDGEFESEQVNGGNFFPANFDKPHDLKVVVNVKLSRRFNFTSNFVYNSGRPISYPVAFYSFGGSDHVYYSYRNEYRIPDYIRLDMSATLNGNLKARKLNHSSFTATIYNVLGRNNPYSIFFRNESGKIKGYQMTIFARPVFMLTYNFRILGNAEGDF